MPRTPHAPIAPPAQQVPRIHHDRAGDRRRAHPRAPRALDLQPAHAVLEEQRDGAVVRVRAGADARGVGGEERGGHGRVVQEPEVVVPAVGVGIEEVGG